MPTSFPVYGVIRHHNKHTYAIMSKLKRVNCVKPVHGATSHLISIRKFGSLSRFRTTFPVYDASLRAFQLYQWYRVRHEHDIVDRSSVSGIF